jgi:predicted unusual protein kinase regulating ubiquinone biosynthesis (AarF/ABC1/UbiB family)
MDERHLLGQKIFDLFLKEIFIFHLVQTDAHGGNYLIDLNEDPLRLKLIDFGACLEFEPELLSMYQNFLRYSYREEKELFLAEFYRFIEFTGKELVFNEDLMWEYMLLATGPLKSNDYDWGSTDLPEQIMELGKELFKQMEFKSIPAQFTFLDRKTVGVFTLLKGLNARFDVKSTFLQYLKD